MHNLIAAIAATPLQDTAPQAEVTASGATPFRDVLCAKVISHGQAQATASTTNPTDSRSQHRVKVNGQLDDTPTTKSRDSKRENKSDPPNPAATPSRPFVIPRDASANAVLGNGIALSDVVGALVRGISGAPVSQATKLASDLSLMSPDGTAISDPEITNQSHSQSQSKVATEADTPSPSSGLNLPFGSTETGANADPISSSCITSSGSGQFLVDALADQVSATQKPVGFNQSPLLTASPATSERRNTLPLQDQPANNEDVNSGNIAPGVTATSPAQVVTVASLFLETSPVEGTLAPQPINSLRQAASARAERSGRNEDRDRARPQTAADTQAESQAVSLKAGDLELTMQRGDVSLALVATEHNPGPDRAAAAAAANGPNPIFVATSQATSDDPHTGDAKAQTTFPLPTYGAEEAPAAASVLQTARVLDRMGTSEIRVGLNTVNFGNLELHTSVNQDRVAATLATSHSDLRAALAAEMPTLAHAMAQHQLTLDSFHLDTHSGAHQNKNHGAPADSQNRSQTWRRAGVDPVSAPDGLLAPETAAPQLWMYSSGLNVQA